MTSQNDVESSKYKDAIMSDEQAIPILVQGGPKRRSSRKVLAAGCIVSLAFMACFMACIGLAIGIFAIASIEAVRGHDEWLALADGFMRAMADKEIDKAYRLVASPARYGFKESDLASFADGPAFAIFDGYASLAIESWTFYYTYPVGLAVEITGPVYYQDEYEGIHQLVLIQENEKWKLLAFNVEVSQEKINSYAAGLRFTSPAAFLERPFTADGKRKDLLEHTGSALRVDVARDDAAVSLRAG